METPAALGAGNWLNVVETRQRRKIAEVRIRISIESSVCHLFWGRCESTGGKKRNAGFSKSTISVASVPDARNQNEMILREEAENDAVMVAEESNAVIVVAG